MNYSINSLQKIGLPFGKNRTERLCHTKHLNKFPMDLRPKYEKQNFQNKIFTLRLRKNS